MWLIQDICGTVIASPEMPRVINMVNEKRLHNRFDEFEIASVFTEYAEEWLPKKWQLVRTQFYIKCLLGVLLFLNGYLSHWGPWPWPSNYYFLIFSVVFYHVATHFYGLQTPVKNHEGNTVGFFEVKGRSMAVVVRIGEDKTKYALQVLDGKSSVAKREISYYEYFTESGVFLSYKFKKVMEEMVETAEKVQQ